MYPVNTFKVKCMFHDYLVGTRSKSTRDQNPPAFKIHPIKIHPVKLENRLPVEGKG